MTGIDSPETNHHLIHARPWYPLENPGIPPAVTALLTVVGRIDGLIHAHTLLLALADIYAD